MSVAAEIMRYRWRSAIMPMMEDGDEAVTERYGRYHLLEKMSAISVQGLNRATAQGLWRSRLVKAGLGATGTGP